MKTQPRLIQAIRMNSEIDIPLSHETEVFPSEIDSQCLRIGRDMAHDLNYNDNKPLHDGNMNNKHGAQCIWKHIAWIVFQWNRMMLFSGEKKMSQYQAEVV